MLALCNVVLRFFFFLYFMTYKKIDILVKLSPTVHVITVEPFTIKSFLRRTVQYLKDIDHYKWNAIFYYYPKTSFKRAYIGAGEPGGEGGVSGPADGQVLKFCRLIVQVGCPTLPHIRVLGFNITTLKIHFKYVVLVRAELGFWWPATQGFCSHVL